MKTWLYDWGMVVLFALLVISLLVFSSWRDRTGTDKIINDNNTHQSPS